MQNRRNIAILVVTMIAIVMLAGCGQVQQYPNFTATPLPAQIDKPIRYDEKDEASHMSPEFAAMRIPSCDEDGLWGFRDIMGSWAVEPKYKSVRDFKEGLAAVAIERDGNEYWGYVNTMGREVIELKYNIARDFSNGLAFAREKNIEGKGTVSNNYIDKDGITVLDFNTDITEGFSFDDDGMAVVYQLDGDTTHYGVIDRDGSFLIPFEKAFQYIGEMPGKCFKARPQKPVDGNLETGVIDRYGDWVIAPKYNNLDVLKDDRVLVCKNDDKGENFKLVSFDSETIADLGYGYPHIGEDPQILIWDMFAFCTNTSEGPSIKLYDIDGNQLLAGNSFEMMRIISEDVIFVADKDGSYLLNKAGEKIEDVDMPYGPTRISEEIIKVPTNSKVGLYNWKQSIWVASPIYDKIAFYNGTQGEAIRDVQKVDGNVTFVIDTFDNMGKVQTIRGETMTESEYDEMVKSIVDISSCYESW